MVSPNLILIFVCLLFGICLRFSNKFPPNAPHVFNGFVVWISFPALVLIQIPALLNTVEPSAQLLIPISMAWIQFALAFVLFTAAGRALKWKAAKTGALVLTAGLGNTSFVGFPLLDSLLGPQSIRIGVLVDQPGSFLTLSTLGILYASIMSPHGGSKPSPGAMAKKVVYFPPFIALVIAMVWWAAGGKATPATHQVLERLADTLVPLALVSVGFQLKLSFSILKKQWKPLSLGLGFKLLLIPAFFAALYLRVLNLSGEMVTVTLLQSAMAPMITAAIVAEEFGFDTEVANLMIGIGIPLSLITVPLWKHLLF